MDGMNGMGGQSNFMQMLMQQMQGRGAPMGGQPPGGMQRAPQTPQRLPQVRQPTQLGMPRGRPMGQGALGGLNTLGQGFDPDTIIGAMRGGR